MIRSLLTCAAILVSSACPMFGSAILADGSYHEFRFLMAVSEVGACVSMGNTLCQPSLNPDNVDMTATPPWTFMGPNDLFIIDVGHIGDRFEVFDFALSLGTTSATSHDGT